MPRSRQPDELWQLTRHKVIERDRYECTHCHVQITFETFHCDHIKSGKNATNEMANLRSLCRRCHVLRSDHRHRGMIASALRDGVIPPNWRELVWD